MSKQKEFEGMPERTALGKKAMEMVSLREELTNVTKKIEDVRKELVQLFVKEGVAEIRVEGHVIAYAHIENDKITVKVEAKDKPRKKAKG